jgi:hypothetical protein
MATDKSIEKSRTYRLGLYISRIIRVNILEKEKGVTCNLGNLTRL